MTTQQSGSSLVVTKRSGLFAAHSLAWRMADRKWWRCLVPPVSASRRCFIGFWIPLPVARSSSVLAAILRSRYPTKRSTPSLMQRVSCSRRSDPDFSATCCPMISVLSVACSRPFGGCRRSMLRPIGSKHRESGNHLELQRRAFEALRELFDALARYRPLAILLDDLQFGDADSAPFIVSLMASRDASRLLLLSYRPDEVDQSPLLRALPDVISHRGATRTLTLGPLGDADATHLATALIPPYLSNLASWVVSESRGNPHFMRELCQYVATVGEVVSEESEMGSLDSVVRQRVSRLDPNAQNLLKILTVARTRIPVHIACRAAEATENASFIIQQLRSEHFIRTTTGDHVEPYHDSIREALDSELDDGERRDLHRRLALSLDDPESDSEEYLFALADHYFFGFDQPSSRGFELNLQAGMRAANAYALEPGVRVPHSRRCDDRRREQRPKP